MACLASESGVRPVLVLAKHDAPTPPVLHARVSISGRVLSSKHCACWFRRSKAPSSTGKVMLPCPRTGAEQFVEGDRDDTSKILSPQEIEKVLEDVAEQLEHSAEALLETVQHVKDTKTTSASAGSTITDVTAADIGGGGEEGLQSSLKMAGEEGARPKAEDVDTQKGISGGEAWEGQVVGSSGADAMLRQALEPSPGEEEGYDKQWDTLGFNAAGSRTAGDDVSQHPSASKAMTVADVGKARAQQAHAYVGEEGGGFSSAAAADEQRREAQHAFDILKEHSAEDRDYVGSVLIGGEGSEAADEARQKGDYIRGKAEDVKEGAKGAAGVVKERAVQTKDFVGSKGTETKDYVGEKAEETGDYIGDKAQETKGFVQDKAEDLSAKAEESKEAVTEKAQQTRDYIGEKAEQTGEYIGEKAEDVKEKAAETRDYIGVEAEQTGDYIGEKVEDTQEAAGNVWEAVVGEFEGAGQRTADNISTSVQQAKEAIDGVFGVVLGATEEAGESVKESAHEAREGLSEGGDVGREGYEGGEEEGEGSEGAQWKGAEGTVTSLDVSEGTVAEIENPTVHTKGESDGGDSEGGLGREEFGDLQAKADEIVRERAKDLPYISMSDHRSRGAKES